MEGLDIGIEPEDSGMGIELCPPADDDGLEEHAAASNAITPAPMARRRAEPGRERPGEGDVDMDRTSSGPRRC